MARNPMRLFLGWDPAEMRAHTVAAMSARARTSIPIDIRRLALIELRMRGLYERPMHRLPNGQLFDEVSGAAMSTEHAITRFFVPFLCEYNGWAMFADADILVRSDLAALWRRRNNRFAVMVVPHALALTGDTKKTGHAQSMYPRKWWSSVMLWNCGHPSNRVLETTGILRTWPGRDLHAFLWLKDTEIGTLPLTWNYLAGVSPPHSDPAIVHYTLGTPDLPEHAHDLYATEWRAAARLAGYYTEEVPA